MTDTSLHLCSVFLASHLVIAEESVSLSAILKLHAFCTVFNKYYLNGPSNPYSCSAAGQLYWSPELPFIFFRTFNACVSSECLLSLCCAVALRSYSLFLFCMLGCVGTVSSFIVCFRFLAREGVYLSD